MAKVNKSTLTKTREWAKHLRPYGKRQQAKGERVAAQRLVREEPHEYENMRTCEPVPSDQNVIWMVLCAETEAELASPPVLVKKSAYARANPNQPFYAAITGKKSKRGKK